MRVRCLGVANHQILAPRGGFGVVAWSVLKNEDLCYFPHPGFFLTISMTEFFSLGIISAPACRTTCSWSG